MTDRFYPVGLEAEADAFKTTYEVQNEMRSFPRSAYPPGTAVHLPGTSATFGFSNPGPIRHRLAQGHLHSTEEVDIPNPRESHAMPCMQVPDDRHTFMVHDTEEMGRSYQSPVAAMTFSGGTPSKSMQSMRKTRSLPSLNKAPAPARLGDAPSPVHRLEDDHFSYFVPRAQAGSGVDKLNPHLMHKLQKSSRISFPFSGEGTGFRSQSGKTALFPEGSYKDVPTTSRMAFSKPPFFRLSPLDHR